MLPKRLHVNEGLINNLDIKILKPRLKFEDDSRKNTTYSNVYQIMNNHYQ